MSSFHIFAKRELRDYLEKQRSKIKSTIESEDDDYLLNVNEFEYIKHMTETSYIEPLIIDFDSVSASSVEKMIPAEWFPPGFDVLKGKSYKRNVIKYHLPFSGNKDLFHYKPSTYIYFFPKVYIEDDTICFEVVNFDDDPEKIKNRADEIISAIRTLYTNVYNEINNFNQSVEDYVEQLVKGRKNYIIKNKKLLSALGVPIKKSANIPSTFAINSLKKKKRINIKKPEVHEKGFKPEPTLDNSIYTEILKIIHDVGKEFERLPNVYSGKSEEQLRDHFLMMLEPNFEGSATGETFNKTGKTDILLRYEGKNVFIAECKFWKGKKSFLDAITQLLGYLTWRDSKAAVVLFVNNMDFSSIIQTVKGCISEHKNYIQSVNEPDETWLNYLFHLPGDKNRMVHLAVMLYHLPKKKG